MSRFFRVLAVLAVLVAPTLGTCPCLLGRSAEAGDANHGARADVCLCCLARASYRGSEGADEPRSPRPHPDECPCCAARSARLAIVDGGDVALQPLGDVLLGIAPQDGPWAGALDLRQEVQALQVSPGPPGRVARAAVLLL